MVGAAYQLCQTGQAGAYGTWAQIDVYVAGPGIYRCRDVLGVFPEVASSGTHLARVVGIHLCRGLVAHAGTRLGDTEIGVVSMVVLH